MPINYVKKVSHIYWGSNMTPREEFRVNGCLRPETQEWLVDFFDDTTALSDEEDSCLIHNYEASIQELKATLLEEDFLTEAIDMIKDLVSRVKGGNKELAVELMSTLENLETQLQQSTEYAMEQIKTLEKGMGTSKKLAEKFGL